MKHDLLKRVALISALALGASISARAGVDLQFQWSGSLYESGFTGTYIQSPDAIGIYAFNTADSSPAINPPQNILYSVCLSPAGLLDGIQHTYNEVPFNQANPGIFPTAWAWNNSVANPQYWGVQNAAYLWSTYGMNVVNGHGVTGVGAPNALNTKNDEGAALEFAIWYVLYNSKGYGSLGGAGSGNVYTTGTGVNYSVPYGQFDSGAQADFNAYVAGMLATGGHIPLYAGDVLEGTGAPADGPLHGDDQEFFLLGTPVPEPSTILAGAMLLLPFGASTLRILRRNRAT